ncbi:MAG: hypothetical protein U1A73_23340 [Pseudomonas sp.]|nr:hypothetical protein [Xanthomonadaceae bacterium]MDZ4327930.1 hypothetical protein [Pseudomonas sp.]
MTGALRLTMDFSFGYISGISIISGFVMQAIYVTKIKMSSDWRKHFIWVFVAFTNVAICALSPLFLLALSVFRNPGGSFVIELSFFLAGLFTGIGFTFVSVLIINSELKKYSKQKQ